ncbi:hypothetical protein EJ05DRAFT_42685 [Pseudovirgaria hyperparasitica]|uniref:Uncharacterized protein n=1 Tax=Pseudovirgaria hyperparasitica TaxID=470096 RepID=A0A6A6WNE3_9PEZI|nr:uncharacterized protein EJ05DRAFT_42685 [Pseudovirgaria hyperparasitica]KAF2763542.1 hypothetical protein EJ05DRAFT_42685 [Pseudovirgaria hyperparasitica]
MYRATPITEQLRQTCWNDTEAGKFVLSKPIWLGVLTLSVISKCIKNGPNKGWGNGPDGQFYETGFRHLNGDGSKHDKFSSDETLKPPGKKIVPTLKDGSLECGEDIDGNGAKIDDCEHIQLSYGFSTHNQTECKSHGDQLDEAGEKIGSWCLVEEHSSCAFVIADAKDHSSEITSNDFNDFRLHTHNKCEKFGTGTVVAAGDAEEDMGLSVQTLCFVNKHHPELCSTKKKS